MIRAPVYAQVKLDGTNVGVQYRKSQEQPGLYGRNKQIAPDGLYQKCNVHDLMVGYDVKVAKVFEQI